VRRFGYIGGGVLALFLWGNTPMGAFGEDAARYIVRFKAPSSATVTSKAFSNRPLAMMAKAERELPLDNSVVVTLNSSERDRLATLPDVESIEVDKKIKAFLVPNDPLYSDQYALKGTHGIRAPLAWNITRGTRAKLVAVIDSGIDFTHEDLQGNIWSNPGEIAANGLDDDSNGYVDDISGYDFGSDEGDSDPTDENGHGTHVSGIIAATGNNGIGVTGVAWNTAVIPVKCLDDTGSGFISYLVNALDYVSTLKDQGYPIAVVNMSLGTDESSAALTRAVRRAASRGIVLVAAAGNSQCGNQTNNDVDPGYPANTESPNVISVAATTAAGKLACFSNYGPRTVDIVAPGSDILSTSPALVTGAAYEYLDGTSMASPVVAGVAALVAAANPSAKPKLIRDIILSTVKPLRSVKDKVVSGGLVDAYSAVKVAVASVKRYTVSGTVKRRTKGVGNVSIALSLATGPRYRKTAVTSSSGRFTFRNVPAGTYTLKAARSGITFATRSQRVVVTASKTVRFTAR
jgi:subtilisin family serine protease